MQAPLVVRERSTRNGIARRPRPSADERLRRNSGLCARTACGLSTQIVSSHAAYAGEPPYRALGGVLLRGRFHDAVERDLVVPDDDTNAIAGYLVVAQ
ncbi:MAG: hypothetical protein ABIQ10_15325 [Gemmatimonadaceae bacterium]